MIGPLPTAITDPDASFLDGQVEVADGVALAYGVVLKAAPGCRLIVAPGVCLGQGVIVQACRGDLVIEPGAVLGSGVLVVGTGRIGPNACIGADSTLINPSVLARQVVPPNALLGDPSPQQRICETGASQPNHRQRSTPEQLPSSAVPPSAEPPQPQSSNTFTPSEPTSPSPDQGNGETADTPDTAEAIATNGLDDVEPADSPNGADAPPVHGQKQVQQLIATLFPHRQPLNGVSAKDKP